MLLAKLKQAIAPLLLGVLITLGFAVLQTHKVHAAGPALINFQGKVVNADGTNVTNGTYNFDFVMYDDPSLGSPSDGVHDKWHELTKSVTVTNGVFQTNLGSATGLPDFNTNNSLYLAVRFNGDAAGYMSPRIQMTSVPYALNADKLGGLSSSGFIQNQSGSQQSSSSFWLSGIGRADTSFTTPLLDTPTGVALALGTTNATAINLNQNTTIAAAKTLTVTSALTSLTSAVGGDGLNVSNSSGTGNIAVFKDNSTAVFTIADNGLVVVQPSTALTNTQIGFKETQTTANVTSGGSTIAHQINLTTTGGNNTTPVTNKGLDIQLVDNGATIQNTDIGINVSLSGSNNSKIQTGIFSAVSTGLGIHANSNGITVSGNNFTCGNDTGNYSIGVCAEATQGAGVYSWSQASGTSFNDFQGAGTYGLNASGGGVGSFYTGLMGSTNQANNAAYTSSGVYGEATGGTGATVYGGYFTIKSGNNATAGAALSAVSIQPASVAGAGVNAVAALSVTGGKGGNTSGTGGQTAGAGGGISLTAGAGGNATGASGNEIGGAAGSVTIAAGAGGTGRGASNNVNGGTVTLQGGAAGTGGGGTAGVAGGVLVKNLGDSTTAFRVQNAAGGATYLTVDTSTPQVIFGAQTVYSGITTDITTGANEALTIVPNGSGSTVFTEDNDTNLQIAATFTGTGPSINPLDIQLTDNASAAGTSYPLSVTNNDNGANAGVPAALGYFKNANAAETVVSGVLAEQTGAGTLTNGLEIKRTAGTITNGIALTGTFGTNLISSTNFTVSAAGAITAASNATIQGGTANLGTNSQAGSLVVFDGSSNTVTLTASGVGTNYSLTLPTAAGGLSQCLQTDSVTASQLVFGSCSGAGGGDNITVNGSAATDANFIDTTATGTVAGTTWTLNTAPNPDTIALSVGNASTTVAGAVTTGTQSFAGDKTFQSTTNSATSFQIQNSAAISLLTVNTNDNRISLGYPVTGVTPTFADSFESGGFTNWTTTQTSGGTTITADTATVHNGKYSAKFVELAANPTYLRKTISATATATVRANVYDTSIGATGNVFMSLDPGSVAAPEVEVSQDSTGAICYFIFQGSAGACSTTKLPTNTWNKLEMTATTGGSGSVKIYLNGALILSFSGNVGTGTFTRAYLGDNDGQAATFYGDDFSVDTSTSSDVATGDALHVDGSTYHNGDLIVTGAAQIHDTSTAAFGIQDATGTDIFKVDTTNSRIGINLGGSAATADLTFGQGANRVINVIAQSTAATAGNNLTINSGQGNTSGAGGILTVQAGQGGATGNGGAVVVQGGTGGSTSGTGGAATLQGGTAVGAFNGGLASVIGGTAASTAGSAGGSVAITGGTGSSTGTGGNGGSITITAGNAAGSASNGGGITITAGSGTGAGTNGGVTIKNAANSTTALQVQNSSSVTLLKVDTLSNNSNNLLTNPSIESAIAGNWTAKNGSGTSTPTQVNTPVYDGSNSLQIVTSGTATNAGVTENVSLSNTTDYVLSVYVSSLSGFVSTAGAGTFDMGFGSGGADTSCLTAQKVPATSWTRMSCSFNTGTLGATPYIYVKQTDATGRTFFIDSAVLETNPNATSKWQDGTISLNGTINSPVIISPQQDSTNTFLVQNSDGINVFGIDTTDTNLVANPGVEVNTTGWAGKSTGTAPVISRDVTNPYLGVAGLKVVTGTTAQDGVKFTFSPNTLIQASTQYTLSFYAKISASSIATFSFGRSENGSETSCVTTGALTTTWTRFSCTFTIGATVGATPYIYMSQGTGTSSITFFVDAVSLEPGATVSPYGSSSIYINGVINSPVNFQNKTDSTTAFQIENASSNSLFTVDTANSQIELGQASSLTGTLTLFNSGAAFSSSIQASASTSANTTWILPTAAATGCLQSTAAGSVATLSIGACGDTHTDTITATGGGTWTKPTNALLVIVDAIGAGGGGGGGASQTGAVARTGGSGGGGGAHARSEFTASNLGSTENYNVGTVGTHGNGGASGANGTDGTVGGNTTFGTTVRLFAGGGGGGRQGVNSGTAGSGGGGGGTGAAGNTGTAAAAAGGGPGLVTAGTTNTSSTGGTGAGSSITTTIAPAEWGGGAGGGHTATPANVAGGTSMFGGGGGGIGGGSNSTPATVNATAGGAAGVYALTGGSGGGAGTSGAAPTGGTAGAAGSSAVAGSGGGGGGGTVTANTAGAVGGGGGAPGGGGGGGGVGSNTSGGGNGGDGGRGELRIYTIRGAGADLAEIYCTNDADMQNGDVVAIDPNLKAGVKKTSGAYDANAIGTISSNPGLVTGDVEEQCAKPVLVALTGRVPVKVSLENGPIKAGDYLTSSSTSGVAMKATKAGQIIGQALTAYDGSQPAAYVVVFVEHGQSNGSKLADILPAQTGDSTSALSAQQQALEYLLSWKDKAIASASISELTTDRVTAGIEVITPSLVADTVSTNTIQSSTTGDVSVSLDNGHKFIVKGKDGSETFSIDSNGSTFGVNLLALGDIESRGGLKVDGDAIFNGESTFNKLAQFVGDVSVRGRATFNSDAGGSAVIKKDGTRVTVTFAKEYTQQPIVSVNLTADQMLLPDGTSEDIHAKEQRLFNAGYSYLISDISTKGFTIVLNKKASEDLKFSWNAVAIKDPGTTEGLPDQTGSP